MIFEGNQTELRYLTISNSKLQYYLVFGIEIVWDWDVFGINQFIRSRKFRTTYKTEACTIF
ncbi:hypothetical protein MHYP_G00355250 [Metynnis hypsauchen]